MYDIYEGLHKASFFTGIAVLVAIFFTLYSIPPFASLFRKNKKPFYKELYYLTNEYHINKIVLVILLLVCSFVLIFTENQLVWLMDGKTDLRIAPEGTYCYYVKAEREEYGGTYTLPAKIQKRDDTYYIENVYFSNGGYLYLKNGENIEFNETFYCEDQDGDIWEMRLTNWKTSHYMVTEYYELSFWRLFFVIGPSCLMILNALFLIFTKNPKYSEENIELQKKYYELLNEKTRAKINLNDTLNNYELTEQQEREFISFYNSCIESIDSKINDIKKDLIQ